MLNQIRDRVAKIPKPRVPRMASGKLFDVATIAAIFLALCALAALIFYNVIPIKTADIKVPVATDKSSYYPGQNISGIFFGETYYKGEIRVLREVFCKDYKATIAPPAGNAFGEFFSTQTEPRKFEGQSVFIGQLPANIPIGLNCVLQFTNVYVINTPFGQRTERYQYYTQNFAIISKERRDQLDCEARGGTFDACQATDNATDQSDETQSDISTPTNSNDSPPRSFDNSNTQTPAQITPNQSTTNNSTTNNTTNNNTTPPAPRPVEVCTVNALGIKLFCRIEYQ